MSVRVFSLAVNVAIPAALTYAAFRVSGGGAVWWWLFYVNLWLLFLLAKDKLAAVKKWRRTPESTLLLLGLIGASPALVAGRFAFHHKTSKQSFIVQMCGVMVVQAGLLWWFWPTVKTFI